MNQLKPGSKTRTETGNLCTVGECVALRPWGKVHLAAATTQDGRTHTAYICRIPNGRGSRTVAHLRLSDIDAQCSAL